MRISLRGKVSVSNPSRARQASSSNTSRPRVDRVGLSAEKACHKAKDAGTCALRESNQAICYDARELNCGQAEQQRPAEQNAKGRPVYAAAYQCSHPGRQDFDGLV